MTKITTLLTIGASATLANAALVLVPNGDFSTAGGASWTQSGSAGTVISYPATGGNTGGYGQIDNTAGAWGGVLVAEGGTGANPATGSGIPIGSLGLTAGQAYDFYIDLIDLGAGGASAGIKIESWNGALISDSGDRNFATTTSWATYTTNYTLAAGTTHVKVVPLTAGAGAVNVGFDNVSVDVVPEPSGTILMSLAALGFAGLRRRK